MCSNAGKFWSCLDSDRASVCASYSGDVCRDANNVAITDPASCVAAGYQWANAEQNFDNVVHAMLTLFEIASLEMWLDPLYAAMDLPDNIGQQPIRNQSPWWALYFVLFVIIGAFLVVNMFIGVVVDNFEKAKTQSGHSLLLTENQQNFVDSIHLVLSQKPEVSMSPPDFDECCLSLKTACFRFVTWDFDGTGKGKLFDMVITMCIYLNVIVMGMSAWTPSSGTYIEPGSDDATDLIESDWNHALDIVNMLFTWIFFAEMAIKMLAFGLHQYFQDAWNTFDCVLVVLSTIAFFLQVLALGAMPLPPQVILPPPHSQLTVVCGVSCFVCFAL